MNELDRLRQQNARLRGIIDQTLQILVNVQPLDMKSRQSRQHIREDVLRATKLLRPVASGVVWDEPVDYSSQPHYRGGED